ncbi:MAG: OmpA family protein [Bacteroidota bacterium]
MGKNKLLPALLLPGLLWLTSCYSEGQYNQQVARADSLAQELNRESQLNDRLQGYIDDLYYQRTNRGSRKVSQLAMIHRTRDAYQKRVLHLLENPVLFKERSTEISESAAKDLQAFVAGLIQEDYAAIMVVGHTDNMEIARDSSWQLSFDRAHQIARYLMELQVTAEKVIPAGRGATTPMVSNHRPQDRAINRRVEFYLLPPENKP